MEGNSAVDDDGESVDGSKVMAIAAKGSQATVGYRKSSAGLNVV